MIAYTYLDLSNTIFNHKDMFKSGLEQFIVDLDIKALNKISNINKKLIKLNSNKYGLIDIEIFIEEFFNTNYKTRIICKLYLDQDLNEDELFDLFDLDKTFTSALLYQIDIFIQEINKELIQLTIPYNIELSYISGNIYIKLDTLIELDIIRYESIHIENNELFENELSMNSSIS